MGGGLKAGEAHGRVDVATAKGEAVDDFGLLAKDEVREAVGEGGVGEERGKRVEDGHIGAAGRGVAAKLVEGVGGDWTGVEEEEEKA